MSDLQLKNKLAMERYGMTFYRLCWVRQKTILCLVKAIEDKEKNEIPACFFPSEKEEEYISNRSIDNFIKSYQEYKKDDSDLEN